MPEPDLAEALRSAILAAGEGWASQPSRLRYVLEGELGTHARGCRPQVHQLIVAAEERIPSRLSAGGDLVADLGSSLAADLAATRGWTPQAAAWTVRTWAAALGVPLSAWESERPVGGGPVLDRSGHRPVAAATVLPEGDAPTPPTVLPAASPWAHLPPPPPPQQQPPPPPPPPPPGGRASTER